MKLSAKGEFGLIELIRKKCLSADNRIILGIGDDAAVIKPNSNRLSVLTTDALIERVHFNLDYFSFYQLGWRALAANLSDIAAMGGKPICSVVTVGLNDRASVENVLQFYNGLLDLSKRFDCAVAGGDIVRSPTELVISISVLGGVQRDKMVTRAGAKVGDWIFVTGELGEAQAGLELLLKRRKNKRLESSAALTSKHLQPVPRLAESESLLDRLKLNSMIDISDGLAADLHHICEESRVGAVLWGDTVPVSSRAKTAAKILGKDPFQFALQGGEEYELLFTAGSKQAGRAFGIGQFKVTAIGEIVPKRQGIRLYRDGHLTKLLVKGYTHF